MDFGCLLADPIMEDIVVKQLFFSSRRYGRFSLHSGRCDACAIRLYIAVFRFPTNCIPIWQGAFFGRQIDSPKREHSKTFQNMRREKRTPNLSIPLSLVRRRLEFADDWSTRVGLSKNCAKFGKSFQIATKLCDFSHEKKRTEVMRARRCGRFFAGAPKP